VTMVLVIPEGESGDSESSKPALQLFQATAKEFRGQYVFAMTSSMEVLDWMLGVEEVGQQQETRKELLTQASVIRYEAGEVPKVFALADHDGDVKAMDEWVRNNALPVSSYLIYDSVAR
jgi:hypothetical protein